MELVAERGATRIPIAPGPKKTELGRGSGLTSSDRTVSRRHASFQIASPSEDGAEGKAGHDVEVRVSFEVIGKNPILIVTQAGGKRIFRKSELGVLATGDRISLSLTNPFFFSLKRCGEAGAEVDRGVLDAVQRREKRTARRKKKEELREGEKEKAGLPSAYGEEEATDAGSESLDSPFEVPDLSQIDPVKEFGFLVRGHEFDHFPRKIRDIKKWNWFLDETRGGSDDDHYPDEDEMAQKKGRRKLKRKGPDNDDEDWTGESEEERVVAAGAGAASTKRPKYLTRSKEQKRTIQTKDSDARKRRLEEEDEEDETLVGFIVDNNEDVDEEQEEVEEEEFDDEDEDDED